jgi:hypothetical protein
MPVAQPQTMGPVRLGSKLRKKISFSLVKINHKTTKINVGNNVYDKPIIE